MVSKPKVGLALGSGGARGWCHIGVIRTLEKHGVRPGIIAGCSMGAFVGAAYAGGGLDALEEWARGLNRTRFMSLIDIRPNSGGLVEGREIVRMLDELGLPERIEDLSLPFAAIATDMESGREVWLREGNLSSAVRASVAIPGVISPQSHDGRWLLDGGLTNPVPVSVCRAMGAEVVIAVNPNARLHGAMWHRAAPGSAWDGVLAALPYAVRGKFGTFLGESNVGTRPPHYFDVISTSIEIMSEQIRRSRLAGEPPHVLLNADLSAMSVLEFYRGSEAIAEGERITQGQAGWIKSCAGLSPEEGEAR